MVARAVVMISGIFSITAMGVSMVVNFAPVILKSRHMQNIVLYFLTDLIIIPGGELPLVAVGQAVQHCCFLRGTAMATVTAFAMGEKSIHCQGVLRSWVLQG